MGRYLKAQLWVLACGGLVGPIFLVTYFALGMAELKWLFWWGLVITAADVLVALAISFISARRAADAEFLAGSGVVGQARITAINETATRINNQPLVSLDLQISGPGLTPFTATDRVLAPVSRMPLLTGRNLVVLVDPATNKFHIDWNRSALLAGMTPARFTLDEDGRTYDLTGRAAPLLEIMRVLHANGVALGPTIDIRSNPTVRAQVMNIVREAAQQATPEQVYAPVQQAAAPISFADRLMELDRLRGAGLITESEHAAKRQQIIADL